jgi:acylphosphatase
LKYFTVNIKGIVQGVGFRYYCYRLAVKYNLRGFVENLDDGSVYLEIEADDKVIDAFMDELRVGPRSAVINSVKVEGKKYENKYSGFQIY